MPLWQYEIEMLTSNPDEIEDMLVQRGDAGWELVTITAGVCEVPFAVFKRPHAQE